MLSHLCYSPFRRTIRLWTINHPLRPSSLCPSRSSSSYTRQQDADVIIVGAGIAGVCASIAAAERGASVLLLDGSHGGGATALSGGVVYAGGGTHQQKEAGYGHDTPENMFAYLKEETGDAVHEATLRRFCEDSAGNLRWLERHGARFEGSLSPYKTSYPTDQYYLYFSGNEKSFPYNRVAKPAPRGHRMKHPGFSGLELWRVLFASAQRLGVRFLPASRVSGVNFDDNGKVSGVEVTRLQASSPGFESHRKLIDKTARYQLVLPRLAATYFNRADAVWRSQAVPSAFHAPAVILAAGGFAFNSEMRKQHVPEYSKVAPLGTRGDDGSGISLGQAAGGHTAKLDRMSAWRFLYPPTALIEGVVVSRAGERMLAEDVYGATLSDVMIREHQSTGYLILDSDQWTKAKMQLPKQTQFPVSLQRMHWLYWGHRKAGSLEGLAAKFGILSGGLKRTVNAYNDAIAKGIEDPMHKTGEYCSPVVKPPFYGIDVSPQAAGIQAVNGLTLGGLCVDGETGLVLTKTGKRIQGLYAAGRTAVGICANGYVSGLSIADGVYSGKRAGKHAAGNT